MSVQFEILRSYLYRLVIVHVSLSFWGRTYIDRPSSCQFEFEFSSWDRTYIDRLSSCQFRSICVFRTILISIGHCLVNLSLSFQVGTAPISIGHCLVNLSLSFQVGTAPISIDHCLVSMSLSFRDHTHIDWSLSCQFNLSFQECTYIDQSFILLV